MPSICVAHLVRRKNGIEPFLRFLQSYTSHPPGIPCDLVIICKGFPENRVPPEYTGALGDIPYIAYFVEDTGYDILPYFKTAGDLSYDYFCFLNSYSIILHEGWLRNLYTHIQGNNVGAAGATGSWQSIYSGSIEWKQRGYPLWKRVLGAPWKLFLKMFFDPFPNYHLRTTAFMISRDVMRKIRHGNMRTKMAAWRFESGKNSMTKQILEMGMRVVIVGRDGKAYDKEEWNRSGIFCGPAAARLGDRPLHHRPPPRSREAPGPTATAPRGRTRPPPFPPPEAPRRARIRRSRGRR